MKRAIVLLVLLTACGEAPPAKVISAPKRTTPHYGDKTAAVMCLMFGGLGRETGDTYERQGDEIILSVGAECQDGSYIYRTVRNKL